MNASTYAHIAQKIRAVRLYRGLKQAELAKAAGVSQQAVSALESTTPTSIRLDTLYKLAAALEIDAVCLQCQDVDVETLLNGSVANVMSRYARASKDAKAWIDRVVDHETNAK